MATLTKEQRDANLDALKTAVDEWADAEVKRIENETKFLRTVLKGRGAEDAAAVNLDEASALLQEELNAFLLTG